MNKRREANANTLHSFLYHIIIDLIKEQNTPELESALIWNTITNSTQMYRNSDGHRIKTTLDVFHQRILIP